jgi:hypothetical protein
MKKPAADNPILDGLYDEPAFRYFTDVDGSLNYTGIHAGCSADSAEPFAAGTDVRSQRPALSPMRTANHYRGAK